jgi:predicted nucleic acid-binding protein
MTFLDSNVLVYAVDARDAGKQKIAKAIVMSARDSAEYVWSRRVLHGRRARLHVLHVLHGQKRNLKQR